MFARSVIAELLGPEGLETDMTAAMVAEDFAYMLQEREGAYIWLGTGEESQNLHSPLYDFNDELLPIGASLWVCAWSKPNCRCMRGRQVTPVRRPL